MTIEAKSQDTPVAVPLAAAGQTGTVAQACVSPTECGATSLVSLGWGDTHLTNHLTCGFAGGC